jgi:DNA segregation ATPase FtsK/SpoIIIE, S-DNA-T family
MPRHRKRARARRSRRRSALHFLPALPQLEQHHRDLIGLGLVALAAFFACVFYLGWAGGEVGEAVADGILFLFGGVGYLTPIVLFGAGALLLLEPILPSVKPFRSGAICLICGLLLALGSGALGPDRPGDGFITDADELRRHGGLVGEGLYWIASTLFSDAGAHILFAFLLLAGALLLTGGSVAGVLKATREGVAATTQRVRRSTSEFAAHVSQRPTERLPEREEPPEVEPVVRATHVEMPVLEHVPEDEPGDPPPGEGGDDEAWDDQDADADPVAEPLPGENEPEPAPEPPRDELARPADPPREADLTPQGERRSAVTEADDYEYRLPQPGFLKRANGSQKVDSRSIERTGNQLVEALSHFSVDAKVIGTVTGPHVTRYELRLAPGIKMSKVAQLKDDLAYSLAAEHVRILAPIPGKQAVGVEVPNRVRKLVHLGDVFQEAPAKWSPLTVWLGKDIAGKAIGTDLAKQPHVLVAGTTGSGKSGCINAMLSSILLKATPNEVRMVLVDPKRVELNHYEQIPHLLTPVVTSPRLAANVLANLLKEMEGRYGVMSSAKTRSLTELNRVRARQGERPLPYILCVIDELADLMMVAPAEVEDAIIRLAQKSRAVGIHLLLATQRPSADVITGMIKANVPARIAFAVSSQTDSRVILDQNGAESLLGQGDMLFRPAGESRSARIQGAYVTEEEIERLTGQWRRQGEPEMHEELLEAVESPEEEGGEGDFDPDQDDLLADAIQTVVQMGSASTSMLQRRLRVGYTRAGRLIDMMERRGVISGYEGSKARQVLIDEADLPRVLEALDEAPGPGGAVASATAPAQD